LLIGGVNTVVSAFYYIKVLKVMTLDSTAEDLEGRETEPLRVPVAVSIYAVFMAALTLGLGVLWGPISNFTKTGVARFRIKPGVDMVRAPAGPPQMGPGGPGGPGGGGNQGGQPADRRPK